VSVVDLLGIVERTKDRTFAVPQFLLANTVITLAQDMVNLSRKSPNEDGYFFNPVEALTASTAFTSA